MRDDVTGQGSSPALIKVCSVETGVENTPPGTNTLEMSFVQGPQKSLSQQVHLTSLASWGRALVTASVTCQVQPIEKEGEGHCRL